VARNFNGTSDFITLSGSSQVYNSNFGGVFAVVRRTSNTNWGGVFNIDRTAQFGSTDLTSFDVAASSAADPNALTAHETVYRSAGPSFTNTSSDGWVIIGFTKPTGNSTVRFHKYVFSTNTWTHTNDSTDFDAGLGTGTQTAVLNIGRADGVNYWAGDIDVVAVYPADKNDTQVETLSTTLTAWLTLSPSGMWVLNQPTTATSVTDVTGNGSNQTALAGTTVVAGSTLTTATRLAEEYAETLTLQTVQTRLVEEYAETLSTYTAPSASLLLEQYALIAYGGTGAVAPAALLEEYAQYAARWAPAGPSSTLGFPASLNPVMWIRAIDTSGTDGSSVTGTLLSQESAHNDVTITSGLTLRLNATYNGGRAWNMTSGAATMKSAATMGLTVAGTPQYGEMWMVVKTNGGSGPTSWEFGTDGATSHYTFSGSVYDDFGNNTRRSFSPTVDPAAWRVYRIRTTSSNQWIADLDNINQATISGVTKAWNGAAAIPLLGSFSGQIAEVILFANRTLTSDEVGYMYGYLNAQHGLSVSGGVATTMNATFGASIPSPVVVAFSASVTAPAVEATFAGTTPALVGGFVGENLLINATLAGTTPAVTGLITVAGPNEATLAGTTPPVTGLFTVAGPLNATLAGVTPAVTGHFTATTGATSITATLAGVTPKVSGFFTTAGPPINATLAGVTPKVTGSFRAGGVTGRLNAVLSTPVVVVNFHGINSTVTGRLNATLIIAQKNKNQIYGPVIVAFRANFPLGAILTGTTPAITGAFEVMLIAPTALFAITAPVTIGGFVAEMWQNATFEAVTPSPLVTDFTTLLSRDATFAGETPSPLVGAFTASVTIWATLTAETPAPAGFIAGANVPPKVIGEPVETGGMTISPYAGRVVIRPNTTRVEVHGG